MPPTLMIDDAYDERGILRDGFAVRIPVRLRDAIPDNLTEVQRSVADDGQRFRVTDGAGNDGLTLHRPGWRVCDGISRSDREQARLEADADAANAWRTPGGGSPETGFGSRGPRQFDPDDPDDSDNKADLVGEGAPQQVKGWKWRQRATRYATEPDGRRSAMPRDGMTVGGVARNHQQNMAGVYADYDASLKNAWRAL
jgi:hypothetical protein